MKRDGLDFIIAPDLDAAESAALKKLAAGLSRVLERPGGHPPVAGSGLLEEIGRRLWKAAALSAETLLDAIEEARDEERPVRLVVEGTDHYHLPWELLYSDHPEIGFAGRHKWCTVLRRLRGRGRKPKAAASPLRILLFTASPDDLDPERSRLDFEGEEELLFTALDRPLSRGEIDIDVAEDGCLKTLLGRLEERAYHAVILSLHGAPARNLRGEEEWGLLFEDGLSFSSSPVAAGDFVDAMDGLSAGHRPGLVVVSACRSARAEETAASIADVTGRLHLAGFERVIGMRQSVDDRAASVFGAELFRRLASGEIVGRAVSLARHEVAKGEWAGVSRRPGASAGAALDPHAQWSLPVLLDRTLDGPLLDLAAPAEKRERPPLPAAIPGDGALRIPVRSEFVGRRGETRRHLRPFLERETPCLLFTGPGGVGKTTLAGLFCRRLLEREPGIRLLGFRAPFEFDRIYEPLRAAAFDGKEEPALLDFIQKEEDIGKRIQRLLASLAGREGSCAFFLDNLESLQEIGTLEGRPEHRESLWLVRAVCGLRDRARVLLTARHPLPASVTEGLPEGAVTLCRVPDAPLGDILHRMKRLRWPAGMGAEGKRRIYRALGGNHRAIEWAAQLLLDAPEKSERLIRALERVEAPPETPEEQVAVVLESMREDLMFSSLRKSLSPAQDRLLRAAALYRVPVNGDGLRALPPPGSDPDRHDADRERLVAYTLLEAVDVPGLELVYYAVPAVVRELLGEAPFDAGELKWLHGAMGTHHRFQGALVTRRLSDDIEAIHHFRQAENHGAADELAEKVCGFYYRTGGFADADRLSGEIAARVSPPPPWWALIRYGMCRHALGFFGEALAAYEKALSVVKNRKDEGVTLNNISQIHQARGDYGTALEYLEKSLAIQREIGDRSGLISTLHNMAHIALQFEQYENAVTYWDEALKIALEIKEAMGIFHVARGFGAFLCRAGNAETGKKLLALSIETGKAAGIHGVEEAEALLAKMNQESAQEGPDDSGG